MNPGYDPDRCQETVYVKDTYRRSGGGSRFTMHYTRRQCSRRRTHGEHCRQHATWEELAGHPLTSTGETEE